MFTMTPHTLALPFRSSPMGAIASTAPTSGRTVTVTSTRKSILFCIDVVHAPYVDRM